jgi:spermidine synthase/lipopolysaccharide biosynthesis regulator YciM
MDRTCSKGIKHEVNAFNRHADNRQLSCYFKMSINKLKKKPILIPAATVFFSSACIMILELVAGRLIARHLGFSLYTWTSVIGVVLAGITIGNYLGGRIADRFNAQKALSVIFGISSIACVVIVVLNNLVPNLVWLWQFGLVFRIFSNVTLIFLVPSTLLGMISPVVAKMALDRGLPVGRTVGDIYAWGAAGSIAGTFLAGFYLISTMGTVAIIWTISACLLAMAILYWTKLWFLYIWAVIFAALVIFGASTAAWAANIGSSLELREHLDPNVIYEDETQYCYIAVKQLSKNPDKRLFIEGIDQHSMIIMDNIEDLQFDYFKLYALVTHQTSLGKKNLSTLTFGGGGCAFPRYVEKVWPGSRVDVVEIDPLVTEAAIHAFGLPRDTSINIYTMDARNYVDNLLEQSDSGRQISKYDFIYEDAFNSTTVPFQLVTKEFNDKIARILTDEGVYIINMIDMYNSGLFLGAAINTLQKTFSNICVLSIRKPLSFSSNFVIAASKRQINLNNIDKDKGKSLKVMDLWVLNKSEIDSLITKAHGIVLTDDYAPVDDLLAPVAVEKAKRILADKYFTQAMKLKDNQKYDESISILRKAVHAYPDVTVTAYDWIGSMLAKQSRWQEAVNAGQVALQYNENAVIKQNVALIYCNVGIALKKIGKKKEAAAHFDKAIEGFGTDLRKDPDNIKIIIALGNALAEKGDFVRATAYFQQAVDKNPYDVDNHVLLVQALRAQGLHELAAEKLRQGIRFMEDNGQKDGAAQLRDYLKSTL